MVDRPFLSWLMPLTLAVALVTTALSSNVQWSVVSDGLWDVMAYVYALLLVAVAAEKTNRHWHQVGFLFAVAVIGIRGVGFGQLVVEAGRWDLAGAVAERLALMVAAFMVHLRGIERETVRGLDS